MYIRLRDEMWWVAKRWFESQNVCVTIESLQMQDLLEEELSTPLALFSSTGKNAVETKSQLKQRGYKSPNLADALCMTFSHDGTVAAGAFGSANSTWNKDMKYEPLACIW